ncbi:MAG: carbon-nitrogen hydrolase family protein [Saprospiraceae bacterium]|nr:MAG: nitrilase/cyanide hydratase and apolipoprotein N-acyltransferase [Candidatus Parvibacillus calidus]MCC7147851.1 carbon-nitrogen hydrolase family protein [Saprospiraceae bacterium]WKZ62968.1 MAG: carbon-nitrogen hydrolase family protein [Saprospiraceae bacterium]
MADRKIKVAAYQYPIVYYHSLDEWRERMEGLVREGCAEGQHLLLFPEYGSMDLVSLFPKEIQQDIHAQLDEMQDLLSEFKGHFSDLARKYGVIIVAPSFPVKESAGLFNRIYVFSPSGKEGHQDKWWMTRFEQEDWGMSEARKELKVFDAGICKFGIQNCYDIEFAIGSHYLTQAGAEVILVPSCTETIRGATRVHVGARARAMEFQCYTVVAQIIGEAQWSPAVDVNYGYPAIYSTPDRKVGKEGIMAIGEAQKPGWLSRELDLSLLNYVRTEGQVLNYRDHQRLLMNLEGEDIEVMVVDMT